MAPCATGTVSPWAGFFDPEPSMLVLVYLNFRQPSRWELGSGFTWVPGTGSRCPGLRPRPRMSQPCFPQAGPRKPRQTHHAAGSTSNHLSRAARLDSARSPGSWGGLHASRGSWSQLPSGWLQAHSRAPGHASSSFSSASALRSPSREAASHTPSRHFRTLGSGPAAQRAPSPKERREAQVWRTRAMLRSPRLGAGLRNPNSHLEVSSRSDFSPEVTDPLCTSCLPCLSRSLYFYSVTRSGLII